MTLECSGNNKLHPRTASAQGRRHCFSGVCTWTYWLFCSMISRVTRFQMICLNWRIGVRGRSKWTKSGLYESFGLVRRWKQHRVTLFLWYLVSIHWLREEIPSSKLNWLYLAMTLLKALFGFRWMAPSGENLWSGLYWLGHYNDNVCACRFLVGGTVFVSIFHCPGAAMVVEGWRWSCML